MVASERRLLDALSSLSTRQREEIIKHLNLPAQKVLRKHVKNLVEGRARRYKLPENDRQVLSKALRPYKTKIKRYIDSTGDQVVQKGGGFGIIGFLLASLIPVIAEAIAGSASKKKKVSAADSAASPAAAAAPKEKKSKKQ